MTSGRARPVVAGVDFSAGGDRAADYAAREALASGRDLKLVHGLVIPIPSVTPFPALYDDDAVREHAYALLDQLAAGLHQRYPGLTISTEVASLAGGITLISESRSASLVVVGSRGEGGFARLLIGSVAGQIATYAACPVIVVPPADPPSDPPADPHADPGAEPDADPDAASEGPVVVGVDGSEFTRRTIGFAFDEAAARHCPLIAVHVWCLPRFGGFTDDTVWSKDPSQAQIQLREAADRLLAESMAGWQSAYPQVSVERRTLHHERPALALLETAGEAGASLLVVGSRGRGGFVGPLLGSVSQSVVSHARLPVAVVHKHPALESERETARAVRHAAAPKA
jgi:nucleotide-binding universal stress UspA family protein